MQAQHRATAGTGWAALRLHPPKQDSTRPIQLAQTCMENG